MHCTGSSGVQRNSTYDGESDLILSTRTRVCIFTPEQRIRSFIQPQRLDIDHNLLPSHSPPASSIKRRRTPRGPARRGVDSLRLEWRQTAPRSTRLSN